MIILFAFLGLAPALAVAAGVVSIPVIIHLINRRRYKIVPWAAMKFLLAAQKQTRKRMRVEQLLLLLVRMLILFLILLAMVSVMPWAESFWSMLHLNRLGDAKSVRKHRVHHIFVLDASLSMNQKTEGQTAFEVARQMALKKIQDGQSGDGYSVLMLKDNPSWLVGEASQDTRKVTREIEAVLPSHGNSALPAALNMVAAKLGEVRARFPSQAVYFFTDMQNSTWLAATSPDAKTEADAKEKSPYLEIQKKATTVFVDCGPSRDASNVAVTHIEFDYSRNTYITAKTPVSLRATVRNYGQQAAQVRAELLMGKAKETANDAPLQLRVVEQENALVAAQSQDVVVFKAVNFPVAGTYAVQVRIAGDALPQDDAHTIIITVRETIPVLLVNGKASADRFERATEYLRLALNPFPPGTEEAWMPLRPRVVSPSQFTDLTDADLALYDCIYWSDVGPFGVNDVRKIDTHLRRGGGFVLSVGDETVKHLDRYNELLYKGGHGLLPAKMIKKITAPKEHHFFLSNSDKNAFRLPPLNAFSEEEDRLTLQTARFREYLQSSVPEGKARTVLSFATEVPAKALKVEPDKTLPASSPAIVEWNPPLARALQPAPPAGKPGQRVRLQPARYRGKVVFLASTINLDWNSWPGSPSFGAMMHELTRLAVTGRLREQSQTVGGVLEAYLPGGAELDVTVKYPPEITGLKPQKGKTQLIDDVNLFRWADTDVSGVYRFETSTGVEIPFAVNVPVFGADQRGSESDLARIDEAKLKEIYPEWTFQVVRDARAASLPGAPVEDGTPQIPLPFGPDLANATLLLVLVLLFLEIVLAWYFGHYTTTEGALTNAPAGPASIALAAGIAIIFTVFFAIGLFVVGTYWWTGDFLGFLPDLIRTWFERRIGVEELQAGEGSTWSYEQMSWLFGLPGNERWYAVILTVAAGLTIFFTYRAEAPRVSLVYKLLLGALRLYLIVFTIWFLLPRPEIHYDREGFPDLVLLIDDTRSMGEPDSFRDPAVIERVKALGESIRVKLQKEVPERLNALEAEIAAKAAAAVNDPDIQAERDELIKRLTYWTRQRDQLNADQWRPSRLQLVQAILAQPEPHWIKSLLTKHRSKVHIFHLDIHGRATKLRDKEGDAGELIDPRDAANIERALAAVDRLEPVGNASRLGVAVKQVIDHYRGSALSSVIMFTDGVTTRDETLSQAADYAAQKGISLFLIGVGDKDKERELRIHELNVEDTIYEGDRAVFEFRLTGKGFKDNVTVPVILKLRQKNGQEKEVAREMAKIDPAGNAVKLRLRDQPKGIGRKHYIIEVEPPKLGPNERPLPPENLRIERTIEVIDTKLTRVLYVEGQPRYEFRYIKFLLEREAEEAKAKKDKKKSIELTVLLLDADDDWAAKDRNDNGGVDKTAIANFPPTLEELSQYDVLILGDCDPNHPKLRNRLKDIAAFAAGEAGQAGKAGKSGGGVLFISGSFHNPHRYKGTPLEKILPVEPLQDRPPADKPLRDTFKPELTPLGRSHPMFRFSPDEERSLAIWERLRKGYWYSSGYVARPLADVLAVHPGVDAAVKRPQQNPKHPLIVQMVLPSGGRSMFFGIDETWRWRAGGDESKYNDFWLQSMRFLARGQPMHTKLWLDRQVPYLVGDKITVRVRFPDSGPAGGDVKGPKITDATDVVVSVTYQPPGAKEGEPQVSTMKLAKVAGSRARYEGDWLRSREGKYRFRLTNPDVSATQPDGEKPSAEAIVQLPPGELENLRMDFAELSSAADKTNGLFVKLDNAEETLDRLPPPPRIHIVSNAPPTLLWNQWWAFVLVVFLISSEWVLRKVKHLL